jgi:hypothetical protein
MSFITWNTEIIDRLKTGSIPAVLLFGDSMDRPAPPYVVVKPLSGGSRKVFQLFVHGAAGTQDILEAYIFRELPDLLREPLRTGGRIIHVRDTGAWLGPYTDEGDTTLAMSRDFYVPVVL